MEQNQFQDHGWKWTEVVVKKTQPCVGEIPRWFTVLYTQFSSVQSLSCPTLCDPMNHSMPGLPTITNSQSLLKLTSIESVMPSSHLILCCPLFLLPPIPPSIRIFSNESTLHMRWPKYWFQLQHHSF